MKYNEKYNRFIDDDLVIYRWDKRLDKLVQVNPTVSKLGYQFICYAPKKIVYVHRFVYETFVGEIPEGYEIDHINTIRVDNRPENLRLVTHKENYNNELTKKHMRVAAKARIVRDGWTGGKLKGTVHSEFGNKFKEHYGLDHSSDLKLYLREYAWYRNHNFKCRWEE